MASCMNPLVQPEIIILPTSETISVFACLFKEFILPSLCKIIILFLTFKALNLNIFSSQNLLDAGFGTEDMAGNKTGHLCNCGVYFLLGTEKINSKYVLQHQLESGAIEL